MSTYQQEMKEKYPNRPYVTRPVWELQNIKKALSSLSGFLNTEEEDIRLNEVIRELKLRRGGKK